MLYPVDFVDASLRHWEDAELLLAENRLANADHLYGLSAECGLKAIMTGWGQETLNPIYKLHVNELWSSFVEWCRAGRDLPDDMVVAETLVWIERCHPFSDWETANRYAGRGCFREKDVRCYREAAQRLHYVVQHGGTERSRQ